MISPQIEKLRHLMKLHNLNYRHVADHAKVSKKTVESWLSKPGCAMHRNMPPSRLIIIKASIDKMYQD